MKEKILDFLILWFRKIPAKFFISMWKAYFADEMTEFENDMHTLGAKVEWTSWDIYGAEYIYYEEKESDLWNYMDWIAAENKFLNNERIRQASEKGWFFFSEAEIDF